MGWRTLLCLRVRGRQGFVAHIVDGDGAVGGLSQSSPRGRARDQSGAGPSRDGGSGARARDGEPAPRRCARRDRARALRATQGLDDEPLRSRDFAGHPGPAASSCRCRCSWRDGRKPELRAAPAPAAHRPLPDVGRRARCWWRGWRRWSGRGAARPHERADARRRQPHGRAWWSPSRSHGSVSGRRGAQQRCDAWVPGPQRCPTAIVPAELSAAVVSAAGGSTHVPAAVAAAAVGVSAARISPRLSAAAGAAAAWISPARVSAAALVSAAAVVSASGLSTGDLRASHGARRSAARRRARRSFTSGGVERAAWTQRRTQRWTQRWRAW